MAKKPYQDTRLAKYVETRVLELKFKKSQAEIAEEAGFLNANMLTMLKQGATKLPLDRVPALALDVRRGSVSPEAARISVIQAISFFVIG